MPEPDIEEKKLTLKQNKFLAKYFETGNSTTAALYAYDCKNVEVARSIAGENLVKLGVVVRQMMEERGLTLPLMIDTIKDATAATKTSNAAILLTKDGKTVKTEEQGLIETPDHLTRIKAVEVASKWLGLGQPNNQFQVNIFNTIKSDQGEYDL